MKPGFFQGKKFPFTPKRRKKSLGSQCNNIIDTRHDLAAFRSKLANVSWLRSYKQVATHYQLCLGVTGAAIVAEDGTPLNAAEDPRATSARRRESFGWALTGRCVVRVTLVTGQRLHTW